MESLGHTVVAVDASAAITLLAEQDFDVVVTGLPPAQEAASDPSSLSIPQELVCLPQPLEIEDLVEAVTKIQNRAEIRQTLERARKTLREEPGENALIIGKSPIMRRILSRVAVVPASNAPVLITGES